MANNVFQVKRTNVSGRTPNTTGSYGTNSQYIAAGEFALNMADGILYSSNGSAIIEIGANNTNQRITNSLTVNNSRNLNFQTVNTSAASYFTQQNDDNFVFYSTNTAYGARPVWGIFANSITSNLQIYVPIQFNSGVVANNSLGVAGQVLTTNGSTTYWSSVGGTGTVTSVATGNGLTGGPITTTGTVSVLANTGIIANSTGLFVNWGSPSVIGDVVANGASFTYANVSGQVNTATLYAATSANIAGSIIANSSGIYPTSNTVGFSLGSATQRWTINALSGAFASFVTMASTVTMSTTTGNINAASQTTGAINLGGVTQTGAITIGVSTNNQTVSIANGATISGNVKTISIGEFGAAGSQTSITIGSSSSNTLITVNANNTLFSGVVNGATLSTGTTFIANSTQITVAVPFSANGGTGTAGHVLTSNGATGSPYWAAAAGGGYYKGGSAAVGTLAVGGQNLFRVNANTLNNNTTIATGENAQATGPITVASGITLTVESGARVAIV